MARVGPCSGVGGSYFTVQDGYGFLRHLALASVGEQSRRVVERQPARLLDLVAKYGRDVAEPAAAVAEEIEADDLEDPHPAAGVDVLDVAELAGRARLDPRLLGD